MGYKLLLADDSITIQKVVAIIFANKDYDANEVYDLAVVDNGNDTLDKAREIMPDVIMVDALMPGKSGYDVCMEVRRDPVLKDIPLLLLVGAFEPFDEEKAAMSGADDHISKPFESQSLIEKVRKLVEIGRERAAASAAVEMDSQVAGTPFIQEAGEMCLQEEMEAPAPAQIYAEDAVVGDAQPDVLGFETMEVVEVTADDDPWGAFDVTEIVDDEDVPQDEILAADEFQSEIIDTVEELEPFVFTEDEQSSIEGGNIISLGEFPEQALNATEESGESFVFKEEATPEEFGVMDSQVHVAEHDQFSTEPVALEENEVFTFEPEEDEAPLAAISSAEVEEIPADVKEVAAPANISLSEEQLKSILASVSREIIEKIAWEVVPDLAESIIKEEIRKIKEGF